MAGSRLYPSFILLVLSLVVFLLFSLSILWYFNIFGTAVVINFFFLLISLVLSVFLLTLLLGFGGIWFLFRQRIVPRFLHYPLIITVNYFLGFVVRMGQAMGFSREYLQQSYIFLTNKMVMNLGACYAPEDILVLAPHCIQEAGCPHRITHDLGNCRQCGQCQVGQLVQMQRKNGFQLAVVTGGTGARQVVKNFNPRAIVAVACERDLMSGIRDVFPRPVLGVINIRPHGPCFNTEVEWVELENAIKTLCKEVG